MFAAAPSSTLNPLVRQLVTAVPDILVPDGNKRPVQLITQSSVETIDSNTFDTIITQPTRAEGLVWIGRRIATPSGLWFVPSAQVDMTPDLAQDFTYARNAAMLVEVYSSTRSTTNATVEGVIDAAMVFDYRDLMSPNRADIMKAAAGGSSFVVNVSASEGVVLGHGPEGIPEELKQPFALSNREDGGNDLVYSTVRYRNSPDGEYVINKDAGNFILDLDVGNGTLVPNLICASMKINLEVSGSGLFDVYCFIVVKGGCDCDASYMYWGYYPSGPDAVWQGTGGPYYGCCYTFNASRQALAVGCGKVGGTGYQPVGEVYTVQSIKIWAQPRADAPLTCHWANVSVVIPGYYDQLNGPTGVILISAMPTSQQIQLTIKRVVEAVPSGALNQFTSGARDLQRFADPQMLSLASVAFNTHNSGVKRAWTKREYAAVSQKASNGEMSIGSVDSLHAAGPLATLGSFLSGMVNKIPIIGDILSPVASALLPAGGEWLDKNLLHASAYQRDINPLYAINNGTVRASGMPGQVVHAQLRHGFAAPPPPQPVLRKVGEIVTGISGGQRGPEAPPREKRNAIFTDESPVPVWATTPIATTMQPTTSKTPAATATFATTTTTTTQSPMAGRPLPDTPSAPEYAEVPERASAVPTNINMSYFDTVKCGDRNGKTCGRGKRPKPRFRAPAKRRNPSACSTTANTRTCALTKVEWKGRMMARGKAPAKSTVDEDAAESVLSVALEAIDKTQATPEFRMSLKSTLIRDFEQVTRSSGCRSGFCAGEYRPSGLVDFVVVKQVVPTGQYPAATVRGWASKNWYQSVAELADPTRRFAALNDNPGWGKYAWFPVVRTVDGVVHGSVYDVIWSNQPIMAVNPQQENEDNTYSQVAFSIRGGGTGREVLALYLDDAICKMNPTIEQRATIEQVGIAALYGGVPNNSYVCVPTLDTLEGPSLGLAAFAALVSAGDHAAYTGVLEAGDYPSPLRVTAVGNLLEKAKLVVSLFRKKFICPIQPETEEWLSIQDDNTGTLVTAIEIMSGQFYRGHVSIVAVSSTDQVIAANIATGVHVKDDSAEGLANTERNKNVQEHYRTIRETPNITEREYDLKPSGFSDVPRTGRIMNLHWWDRFEEGQLPVKIDKIKHAIKEGMDDRLVGWANQAMQRKLSHERNLDMKATKRAKVANQPDTRILPSLFKSQQVQVQGLTTGRTRKAPQVVSTPRVPSSPANAPVARRDRSRSPLPGPSTEQQADDDYNPFA